MQWSFARLSIELVKLGNEENCGGIKALLQLLQKGFQMGGSKGLKLALSFMMSLCKPNDMVINCLRFLQAIQGF